ncbi:alpha/beta hydrolase [Thalassotalea sp. PP2-459]|uniref:alpha/beta hydrolase n=1 Tax=Thalassotalea sp. PP2-459 TaxID=1742724 RepID=UPI000943264D|nr:alpha/beta hydrolase [Thalassotalea sp. PP2-459]OKY26779.1 hypothetical protein BI291_01940 [Thalassotalea sp. PP2-459]
MTETVYRNFSLQALAREYSPSSCVANLDIYLQQYAEQSQQVKQLASHHGSLKENLRYGQSPDETLDLFLPHHHNSQRSTISIKRKLQVFIHGGYWQELSKEESCFAANNFQQHGYHVAVINYTLAPKASLTKIVNQVRNAIAWLYRHADQYGYDKDQIYLSGSSAGAQLAVMAAMTDWQTTFDLTANPVKGVCAVSGIYDLTPLQFTYINEALALTQDEITHLSPLLAANKLTHCNETRFIVAYGDHETDEFKRQSNDFYQLNCLGCNKVLLANIENKNHFDVITTLSDKKSTLFNSVLKQMEA